MRCRHAIGAGVAAAQHNDTFAARVDHRIDRFSRLPPVFFCEVIHCPIDPVELPAGCRDLAWQLCANRETDRVKFIPQLLERNVHTNICAGAENHAFTPQLIDAACDLVFAELEIRYAVDNQAADLVVALKNCYFVSGTVKLLSCGKPGRAAPDYCHTFTGPNFGRLRRDPALRQTKVPDCSFDAFDGDW